MAMVLLNTFFWTVSKAANVVSLAVFKTGAVFVVLMTQILRLPWAALSSVPNLVATVIRAAAEWIVGNLVKLTLSIIANLITAAPKVVSGLASVASFNATALVEETRHRLEDVMEIAPAAFTGATETLHSVLEAFLHSYKHAAKYVMKKVE